jgi:hypothetical protein
VLTGAGALLGLALLNPDSWIAERNLDRYEETGKVDWFYLQGLSEDVVPALEDQPDDVVRCVLRARDASDDDWLEWNLGRHRAQAEIRAVLEREGVDEPSCASVD